MESVLVRFRTFVIQAQLADYLPDVAISLYTPPLRIPQVNVAPIALLSSGA